MVEFGSHQRWMSVPGYHQPEFNAKPQVYTGNNLSRLKEVSGLLLAEAPFKGVFRAQAGVEYQIAVDGPVDYNYVQSGAFELKLSLSGLTILSPTHETVAVTPPALPLSAASLLPDVDGALGPVTFFARDLLLNQDLKLGSASGPSYELAWTAPPPGYYSIQARATNQLGRVIDSNPVVIALRPANDDFANRIQLTGYAVTLDVNMNAATRVRSDPRVAYFLGDLHGGGVEGSVCGGGRRLPAAGPRRAVSLSASPPPGRPAGRCHPSSNHPAAAASFRQAGVLIISSPRIVTPLTRPTGPPSNSRSTRFGSRCRPTRRHSARLLRSPSRS
jgi:hypothetical protein